MSNKTDLCLYIYVHYTAEKTRIVVNFTNACVTSVATSKRFITSTEPSEKFRCNRSLKKFESWFFYRKKSSGMLVCWLISSLILTILNSITINKWLTRYCQQDRILCHSCIGESAMRFLWESLFVWVAAYVLYSISITHDVPFQLGCRHISQLPLTRFHCLCVMREDNDRDIWIFTCIPHSVWGRMLLHAIGRQVKVKKGRHTNSPFSRGQLGLPTHAVRALRDADGIIWSVDWTAEYRGTGRNLSPGNMRDGEWGKLCHFLLINCPLGKGKWDRGKTNIPNYNLRCLLSTEIRRKRLLNRPIKIRLRRKWPTATIRGLSWILGKYKNDLHIK